MRCRVYTLHIEQLLSDSAIREWLIPDYQRPYVWAESDRALLVDSINQGIPLGTIILWRNHILDGQQRVLSLLYLMDRRLCLTTGAVGEAGVPIRVVLDIVQLLELDLTKAQIRVAAQFIEWLRRTHVTLIEIEGSWDYARLVYERVNQGGVPNNLDTARGKTVTVASQLTLGAG